MSTRRGRFAAALFLLAIATPVAAQTFEIVGTRAAGMGGAFVAVADDASATYWNPGGLALGHMFSAVVDRNVTDVKPDSLDDSSGHQTGSLIALAMPALGFGHYQLRTTSVTPAGTMLLRSPQGGETPVRMVRLDK